VPAYTFATMLDERIRLFVKLRNPACNHSSELDVEALAARLGAAHDAILEGLVGLFYCRRCDEAGRTKRPVFFTLVPDYGGMDRSRGCVPGAA
jgi:hypothetical protein